MTQPRALEEARRQVDDERRRADEAERRAAALQAELDRLRTPR